MFSRFWVCLHSEYSTILSILVSWIFQGCEYATGFWIYHGFKCARITQGSEYPWICLNSSCIYLIISKYVWICLNSFFYIYWLLKKDLRLFSYFSIVARSIRFWFFCLFVFFQVRFQIRCYLLEWRSPWPGVFKPCSQHVRDSWWWGSLTMVPAGNKAKRVSSVNHTTKTIHQFNSILQFNDTPNKYIYDCFLMNFHLFCCCCFFTFWSFKGLNKRS